MIGITTGMPAALANPTCPGVLHELLAELDRIAAGGEVE
jgi:hypothetical protein